MSNCKYSNKPLEYSRELDHNHKPIPYICECQDLAKQSIDYYYNQALQDAINCLPLVRRLSRKTIIRFINSLKK